MLAVCFGALQLDQAGLVLARRHLGALRIELHLHRTRQLLLLNQCLLTLMLVVLVRRSEVDPNLFAL